MMRHTPKQTRTEPDLFDGELFPVRRPIETSRPVDLSLRVKTAMGQALKACPDSTTIVAARIAELTGRDFTVDALYACTAPSKPEHDMGIARFIAFVRVTGAFWLWDLLVEDDGLVVLEGREAKLAQAGHLHHQRQLLDEQLAELTRELGHVPLKTGAARRRA